MGLYKRRIGPKVALMKAIRIHKYGNADTLTYEDAPMPEPGPEEIRIRVHASAVNPVDWKIREGYLQPMLNHPLPLTLGWDVSGEVVSIGVEVTHLKVGDAVYSRPEISKNGSFAEYMTATADEVAIKPSALTWQEAAGVPLAALTALQSLYAFANLQARERVLIPGGFGAVGQLATQLA
mgnify:CR=1 FL=1